jgi:hypothetical protein
MTKDIRPHVKFSFSSMLSKTGTKFFIGFFSEGMRFVSWGVFWVVVIFLMFNDIELVGFSTTAAAIGGIASNYLSIKKRFSINSMLRFGGPALAVVWLVILYVPDAFSVIAVSLAGGFVGVLLQVAYESKAWAVARKKSPDEFVVFREMSLNAGRIFIIALALFVVEKFVLVFSISSLASVVFIFL